MQLSLDLLYHKLTSLTITSAVCVAALARVEAGSALESWGGQRVHTQDLVDLTERDETQSVLVEKHVNNNMIAQNSQANYLNI